jgi:transcriptional regulator with XRE-family HTH domain
VNTSLVKRDLLNSLKDREFREAFNEENVYTGICFQIRVLREQREKSQKQLGQLAEMAQERISILEDPNAETKPTIATLLRLADACGVGLDVRFVPFSTVLDRSVHTDAKYLEVESFDKELPALEIAIESELVEKKQPARTEQSAWENLQGDEQDNDGSKLAMENAALGIKPFPNPTNPFDQARAS